MTLRNSHHEIKTWGRAHVREIDHESIFTLKGYPRRRGSSCVMRAHAWRFWECSKFFVLLVECEKKLKKKKWESEIRSNPDRHCSSLSLESEGEHKKTCVLSKVPEYFSETQKKYHKVKKYKIQNWKILFNLNSGTCNKI